MRGVTSAPVGCRDIHGRMLAHELRIGKACALTPRSPTCRWLHGQGSGFRHVDPLAVSFRPQSSSKKPAEAGLTRARRLLNSGSAVTSCEGHRVEAQDLALPLRSLARLGQELKSGGTGG